MALSFEQSGKPGTYATGNPMYPARWREDMSLMDPQFLDVQKQLQAGMQPAREEENALVTNLMRQRGMYGSQPHLAALGTMTRNQEAARQQQALNLLSLGSQRQQAAINRVYGQHFDELDFSKQQNAAAAANKAAGSPLMQGLGMVAGMALGPKMPGLGGGGGGAVGSGMSSVGRSLIQSKPQTNTFAQGWANMGMNTNPGMMGGGFAPGWQNMNNQVYRNRNAGAMYNAINPFGE